MISIISKFVSIISLHLQSSPTFSYLLPLSPIFNSCFLPHQQGKSFINYTSYLSGLLVITQFPLLSSPPNAAPDFNLFVFDQLIPTFRVKLGLWSCHCRTTMSFMDVDSFVKKRSWTSFISTSISYLQISSIVIYE